MGVKLTRLVLALAAGSGLVAACGSEDGGPIRPRDGLTENTFEQSPGSPTAPTANSVCAQKTAEGERLPLHLVVVLDKSGSMCRPDNCGPESRWAQAKTALTAFFGSAESKGITASVIPFPYAEPACNPTSYAKALIGDIALPDTGKIKGALDGLYPSGLTPTREALTGAMSYAEGVMARTGERTVVVLATDGLPEGCVGNDIASASAVARSGSSRVPTYVIGVGGGLVNLNQLAASGGTGQAWLVGQSTAASVGRELLAAMENIRRSNAGCSYKIPPPPAGKALDARQVNVEINAGTPSARTIRYSADCAEAGWHYDDAKKPTRIDLCPAACQSVVSDSTLRLSVVFGCATQGDVR